MESTIMIGIMWVLINQFNSIDFEESPANAITSGMFVVVYILLMFLES